MIFVTVGTHPVGFQRLLNYTPRIADALEEAIITQAGNTPYLPPHEAITHHRTIESDDRMQQFIQQARWVVGHAGAGTILTSIRNGANLVCVPREHQRNEHIDNHQEQTAQKFQKNGFIDVARDPDTLISILQRDPAPAPTPPPGRLVQHLQDSIATHEPT